MKMFFESDLYEKHKAYENNEAIETVYTITKDVIEVESADGYVGLADIKRQPYISREAFADLFKQVRREARKQGTQMKGINKFQAEIQDRYNAYDAEFTAYDKQFDVLVLLWEQYKNNIKKGFSEDAIYSEVLKPREWELEELWYDNNLRYFQRNYEILNRFLKRLQSETVVQVTLY